MNQTGMNFVFSSGILDGVKVTMDVKDVGLKYALNLIFKDTDIKYKIKGKSILLIRKPSKPKKKTIFVNEGIRPDIKVTDSIPSVMLNEVLVESRLNHLPISSSEIGAMKLSAEDVAVTPVFLGEDDVMKTFQMQPGITQVAEGMAGISVHGGDVDQNMVMLDNVPLYSGDHCLGLFSAFNVDAIGHIDFYKLSMPARYDGRLSSYLDVRTKNGSRERRNGSVRLGLATGAFSINGPIGENTTYSVALRRSWSEILTLPLAGLISLSSDDRYNVGWAFTDLTGKVTHTFNKRTAGFVSVYYGEDWFHGASSMKDDVYWSSITSRDNRYDLRWGNLVVQAGMKHRLTDEMSAEFTVAYTRFFSSMKEHTKTKAVYGEDNVYNSWLKGKTSNNIGDLIVKGDFEWRPVESQRIGFGAGYTLHTFLPEKSSRRYIQDNVTVTAMDSTWRYIAHEGNIYMEDDWRINDRVRMNAGVHASVFSIEGKARLGLSPRLSISYNPLSDIALKCAYSRTTQYVHRLGQSYISLPTDQWIPITGRFKPETADKIAAGVYWLIDEGKFSASIEGYLKRMHNLIDYRDEYYLKLPMETWNSVLCSGKGSAKGIDFKIEKRSGAFTGHIAYSLAWADRTFADKNGGKTFPSRLDDRHTINVLANWDISKKVRLSAAWTGHSGSRFTLMTQVWHGSEETDGWWMFEESALKTGLNSYRLPFYHRLDLSCTVRNRRGFWNFSLYNAYCHMNTIGIRRAFDKEGNPVFQKIALLPIIPSASYTWIF
ncbi:MAG: hypothetical protein K2M16_06280 [Muribaculaceae bacterium]|nr:hypothetical protein [Muribaculaceae bacterium]